MANLESLVYIQQNKLLTSWLFSTVAPSVLSNFADVKIVNDVWITATRLFVAVSGAKLSRIHHDLHSIKKGAMSIMEYVAKIQNTCALIDAAKSRIFEAEKVEIVLAGLPSEYDIVLTLASFSSEPLPFQCLVDVFLEFESQQVRAVQEEPVHAHLVEALSSPVVVNSGRRG